MLSFDPVVLLRCSCTRILQNYPMLKKIFFHATELCSIITSHTFNLFVILPFRHRKKFISAGDTSFLSINKKPKLHMRNHRQL